MSDWKAEQLAECLDWMEREGAGLEELQENFPEIGQEFESLFKLTEGMKSLSAIEPDPNFARNARIRLENRLARAEQTVTPGRRIRLNKRILQLRPFRRHAMNWIIAIATAIAMLAGGAGAAFAADGALPGDPLYGVDLAVEGIQLRISTQNRTQLMLRNANERLAELEDLAGQGRIEDIPQGLQQYNQALNALMAQTRTNYDEISENGQGDLLRIRQQLQTHEQKLEQLRTRLQTHEGIAAQLQGTIQQLRQAQQGPRWEDELPGQSETAPNQNQGETAPGAGGQPEDPGNDEAPQAGPGPGNEDSGTGQMGPGNQDAPYRKQGSDDSGAGSGGQGGSDNGNGNEGPGPGGGEGGDNGNGQGGSDNDNGQNGSGGQGGSGNGPGGNPYP